MLRICMNNRDMLDLYPRAQIGAKVTVTWARVDADRICLCARQGSASGGDGSLGTLETAE